MASDCKEFIDNGSQGFINWHISGETDNIKTNKNI
jgi:hypothetical protein